jgi:hypothetical protein
MMTFPNASTVKNLILELRSSDNTVVSNAAKRLGSLFRQYPTSVIVDPMTQAEVIGYVITLLAAPNHEAAGYAALILPNLLINYPHPLPSVFWSSKNGHFI